jgi:hypothetical protein
VTGPGSFSQLATLVSTNPTTDAATIVATYQMNGPSGGWTAANAGQYTATLLANQVKDLAGNYTAGETLGTFDVNNGTTTLSISSVVVAEATPTNGKLESNEQLVITWAVNSTAATAESLKVDGNAVAPVYGPYVSGTSSMFAGVFGPLAVGHHTYTIESSNSQGSANPISGTFDVVAPNTSQGAIDHVVVAETNAPSSGKLESNQQLVITWSFTDTASTTTKSLSVDGKAVATIYGPYVAGANTTNWAGVFGPLAAGTHQYVIKMSDSAHDYSYDGTFRVTAVGMTIGNVVVAEAMPTNGILQSNESGVITCSITDADAAVAAQTVPSVTIDGKPVSTQYGPYTTGSNTTYNWAAVFGPLAKGTHHYVIRATGSNGDVATAMGTFTVYAPGTLTIPPTI